MRLTTGKCCLTADQAGSPPRICRAILESSPNHWARELGHEVRLIAPTYVKLLLKRRKNDAAGNCAEWAIWSFALARHNASSHSTASSTECAIRKRSSDAEGPP